MTDKRKEMISDFIHTAPVAIVMGLLLIGFVLLIKGADAFVEGSSAIAKRFHVSSIVIGLTIVAMGTSLPETAVSVTAALTGNNTLAVSNAIGSNIFNLLAVIGLCALINTIDVEKETTARDIPVSAFAAVLLLVLGFLSIGDSAGMTVGHLDGIILLIVFVIYMISLFRRTFSTSKEAAGNSDAETLKDIISVPRSIIYIILGAAAIAIGGDLTVDSASRVAVEFGMSQTLVGLTIVSIGTSLPELVTSIVAARKNEIGMALGNAVGSNLFNILMVLGIASAIHPIDLIMENVMDIALLIVFTLFVWIFAKTRQKLSRPEGAVMLAMYVCYALYICIR